MGKEKNSADNSRVLAEDVDVFLAVVIADSYNNSLQPCTLDRSRVLVPLANKPLLDYTLAFLSLAGIQEVIVYCTSYPHQIKSYVQSSKWNSSMLIKVIINENAMNVGDALRDLDDKQMISTDFVLVNGDLVANFDLKLCLETHKQTREADKDAILTKVMKKCPPNHIIRSPAASQELYALNKSTNQILAHMKVGGAGKVKLPTELIRDNKSLQLRYDLLDCHVTVCAAMVPSLLTDNFDYQSIDDLIHGVLGNQEILGNSMHVDVLDEGYAARAADFHSYKTVSRDVIDKWAYPFCPDRAWGNAADTAADVHFGNNYIVSSNQFGKNCKLEKNVVIGHDTSIGDGTVLSNSSLGNNCRIGAGVVIKNSIIWDGTNIGDNCKVYNSILCEGVRLYQSTCLGAASSNDAPQYILGKGVQLGPDVTITETVMLTAHAPTSEWADEATVAAYSHAGSRGKAYPFHQQTEDSQSDDDMDAASADGDMADDDLIIPDTELFYGEVLDTMQRAMAENISAENIILDINSLKHAYNIQINEVNHMLIQAVLDRPTASTTTSAQLLTSLKPLLKLCLGVFKNYYRSEKSQLECLQAIQEFVCDPSHTLYIPITCQVLMYFYQSDVLEEEVITNWYKNIPAGSLRTEVTKLVEWFTDADSESD